MNSHGEYQISRSGNIILSKCIGGWNEQCAVQYAQSYMDCAIRFESAWCSIIDLTMWELATPEVWAVIERINQWDHQNNLKHDLVVASSPLKLNLLVKEVSNYDTSKLTTFKTVSNALLWLESKGFEPEDTWVTEFNTMQR